MLLSDVIQEVLTTELQVIEFERENESDLKEFLLAIQKNPNITQLNLSANQIEERKECCMIARCIINSNITQIDLSNNLIDEVGEKLILNAVDRVFSDTSRKVSVDFTNNPCSQNKENEAILTNFSRHCKGVSYYPAKEEEQASRFFSQLKL